MIPVYMMTNDYSKHILRAATRLFNKNWSYDIDVTVLGFSGPAVEMPKNFKFVSLGKQSSFSFKRGGMKYYYWTDPMVPFLKKQSHKTFLLIYDEHVIVKPINTKMVQYLYDQVNIGNALKAMTDNSLTMGKFSAGVHEYADDVVQLHQKTKYRSSLMPGIWNKKYLLGMMAPRLTAWEFETVNIKKTINDGAVILAPKKSAIEIFNVYVKGKFANKGFDALKIPAGDKKLIRKMSKKRMY